MLVYVCVVWQRRPSKMAPATNRRHVITDYKQRQMCKSNFVNVYTAHFESLAFITGPMKVLWFVVCPSVRLVRAFNSRTSSDLLEIPAVTRVTRVSEMRMSKIKVTMSYTLWTIKRWQYVCNHNSGKSWWILITFTYLETVINTLCI